MQPSGRQDHPEVGLRQDRPYDARYHGAGQFHEPYHVGFAKPEATYGGQPNDAGQYHNPYHVGFAAQEKPHGAQYNGADASTQFVALKTGQAVTETSLATTIKIPRHVEKVGDREFEQEVIRSGDTVLVDFYADWCGPCKKLASVLDELAQETPDARIVKVNIDRSPKLAKHYSVRSIPTLILFKDGKPVTRRTGLNSKASLKELISQ
jgi:thioredoxin 1